MKHLAAVCLIVLCATGSAFAGSKIPIPPPRLDIPTPANAPIPPPKQFIKTPRYVDIPPPRPTTTAYRRTMVA